MRIIKTAGTSETNIEGERKFVSRPTTKTPVEERLVIERYANDYNKVIIGQWMSIIDKIITKPRTSKSGKSQKPTEPQYKARDLLGEECWKILAEKPVLDLSGDQNSKQDEIASLRAYWEWRLHPYGNSEHILLKGGGFAKVESPFAGRWHTPFTDYKAMAWAIHNHLHVVEVKIDGTKRIPTHPEKTELGLIDTRANSITENSHSRRLLQAMEKKKEKRFGMILAKQWNTADEERLVEKGDLAATIYNANRSAEKRSHSKAKKMLSLRSAEAGALISAHYKEQFLNEEGEVPPRRKIAETHRGLLNLYDAIRVYYKTLLRSHKKSILSQTLPKDCNDLFKLLKVKNRNRSTNDLIRLGRVLHFHHAEHFGSYNLDPQLFDLAQENLAKSRFWTSTGQAELKRTETFVRLWRNAISQGSRSLKNLVDPHDDYDRDILEQKFADRFNRRDFNFTEEDEERYQTSILTLFGESAVWFLEKKQKNESGTWKVAPGKLAYLALRTMGTCRNGVFHFSDRVRFIDLIKDKLTKLYDANKEVAERANLMLQADELLKGDRLNKICKGAGLQKFANQEELNAYLELIRTDKSTDTTLPKFNSLLERMANVSLLDMNALGSLPDPASHTEMTDQTRAKFIGLRLVYDNSFKIWLDQNGNNPAHVKTWIETAVHEADKRHEEFKWEEARQAALRQLKNKSGKNKSDEQVPEPSKEEIQEFLDPHHDLFLSRVKVAFEGLAGQVRLNEFMKRLTAETAAEMQIQKGYASDPEASSKHGKWINNFRIEVIGCAFREYLSEPDILDRTGWLLTLQEETPVSQEEASYDVTPQFYAPKAEGYKELKPQGKATHWKSLLYLMLHFIPVDDVALLLHQFKKWRALEKKRNTGGDEADNEDVTSVRQLLELYQFMHDAKFDGDDIGIGLDDFEAMFESKKDFRRLFLDPNQEDDLLAGTRRGLREISRFGHLPALKHVIKENRIERSKVQELLNFNQLVEYDGKQHTLIAHYQLKKKALHKQIVDAPEEADEADYAEYQRLVRKITEHKDLVSAVRLNGLIKTHRLLMSILSRLVDFSAIWERDLYFISLGLLYQLGKKPDEVFTNEALSSFLERGKVGTKNGEIQDHDFQKSLNRYHNPQDRQIRNDLAHLNILATKRGPVDLTREVNNVRDLLKYDRKLRNAVTKSIIDLMYKEGFNLTWRCEDHKMRELAIIPREFEHLRNFRRMRLEQLKQAKLDEANKERQKKNWRLKDRLTSGEVKSLEQNHPAITEKTLSDIHIQLVKSLWGIESDSETDEHVDKKRKNGRKKRRDRRYYGKKR